MLARCMPQSNPKSGHRQNFSKVCYRSLREKEAEAEYKASSRLAVKAISRLGLGTASREKMQMEIQSEDPYLSSYNLSLMQDPRVQQYHRDKEQGSLHAGIGLSRYTDREGLPLIQLRQRVYYPANRPQSSDFIPADPVTFVVNGRKGISVVDAASHKTQGLEDADKEVVLSTTSTKVDLRLLLQLDLEGSRFSDHASVARLPARRETNPPKGHQLRNVASDFSEAIEGFFQVEGGFIMLPVGRHGLMPVYAEQLLLLEVRHVSKGSYQAVLAIHDTAYI